MIQGMIYDRTAQDVSRCKELRNKLQKGEVLTEGEIALFERGSVTINTLNRIESAQGFIKATLKPMGYYASSVVNKGWFDGDIFFEADLKRIVDNTKALRSAFFDFASTPSNPREEYHFREFNHIEKILDDINIMIPLVQGLYRECGTIESGE